MTVDLGTVLRQASLSPIRVTSQGISLGLDGHLWKTYRCPVIDGYVDWAGVGLRVTLLAGTPPRGDLDSTIWQDLLEGVRAELDHRTT